MSENREVTADIGCSREEGGGDISACSRVLSCFFLPPSNPDIKYTITTSSGIIPARTIYLARSSGIVVVFLIPAGWGRGGAQASVPPQIDLKKKENMKKLRK